MNVVCVGPTNLIGESLGSEPGSSCVLRKKRSNEQHAGKSWGQQGFINIHEKQQFQQAWLLLEALVFTSPGQFPL